MRISDWSSDVCSSDLMAFSDACMASGVQPIIGTMLGVCRPDMPEGVEAPLDWLALYAQDKTGYDNLCALVSRAHLDRPIEQPAHVSFDDLQGHTQGLIALTAGREGARSEEHTSELQSLMRISYAVFCLKQKTQINKNRTESKAT